MSSTTVSEVCPVDPATAPQESAKPAAARPRFRFKRWVHAALILVGLAGLAVCFYEEVYEERWIVKRFGVVEPGLIYRSGQVPAPIIEDVLQKYGIEVVVDLTVRHPEINAQNAELAACKKLGVEHHRYPMGGNGVGTPELYAAAIAKIHECREAGRPVLVHCEAGTQRTGGIISGYRMLVEGAEPILAYEEALRYKWDPEEDKAWPRFLNENMAQIASGLVVAGAIDQMPEELPAFPVW